MQRVQPQNTEPHQSSRMVMTNPMQVIAVQLELDPEIFQNPARLITSVRGGIPGKTLKQALAHFHCPELFANALGTNHKGLEEDCASPC